jgi:hypothetical protein
VHDFLFLIVCCLLCIGIAETCAISGSGHTGEEGELHGAKRGDQEELADVIVNIHKWNGEALLWVLIDYEFVLK